MEKIKDLLDIFMTPNPEYSLDQLHLPRVIETNLDCEAKTDPVLSCALDDRDIPISPETQGGKGVSLMEMDRLGLPVPPGFILTTYA